MSPHDDIRRIAEAVRQAMLKIPPLPAYPPKALQYPTNQPAQARRHQE